MDTTIFATISVIQTVSVKAATSKLIGSIINYISIPKTEFKIRCLLWEDPNLQDEAVLKQIDAENAGPSGISKLVINSQYNLISDHFRPTQTTEAKK